MKTKLFLLTALTIAALDICPFVVAQTDISPTPTQSAQPSRSQRMQGMDEMAGMDSVKRMADMCQEMMKGEKAAMPYIIGVSVLFGLLLFIALVTDSKCRCSTRACSSYSKSSGSNIGVEF